MGLPSMYASVGLFAPVLATLNAVLRFSAVPLPIAKYSW